MAVLMGILRFFQNYAMMLQLSWLKLEVAEDFQFTAD
jgi:hypothetical protein